MRTPSTSNLEGGRAPAERALTVGCPLCPWTTRLIPTTPAITLAEAGRWMAQLHALRHLDRELSPADFEFRLGARVD